MVCNLSTIKTLLCDSGHLLCTFDAFQYFKHVYTNNTCIFPPKHFWVLSCILRQLLSRSVSPIQFLAVFSLGTCIGFHFHSNKMQKMECVKLSEYTLVKGVKWNQREYCYYFKWIYNLASQSLPCLVTGRENFQSVTQSLNFPLLSLFSVVVCIPGVFFLNDSAYKILKYDAFLEDQAIKTTTFWSSILSVT